MFLSDPSRLSECWCFVNVKLCGQESIEFGIHGSVDGKKKTLETETAVPSELSLSSELCQHVSGELAECALGNLEVLREREKTHAVLRFRQPQGTEGVRRGWEPAGTWAKRAQEAPAVPPGAKEPRAVVDGCPPLSCRGPRVAAGPSRCSLPR